MPILSRGARAGADPTCGPPRDLQWPGSYDRRLTEVADRVWVAHHAWLEINVTVVAGERGLAVVDTLGLGAAAERAPCRRTSAGLRAPGDGLVAVVNTHEHWDHVLGNATLRSTWPGAALHAHEEAAARTREAVERVKGYFRDDDDDPYGPDVLASEVLPAETTFSSVGRRRPRRPGAGADAPRARPHRRRPRGAGPRRRRRVLRRPRGGGRAAGVRRRLASRWSGPPASTPRSASRPSRRPSCPGHGAVVPRDFVTEQRGDITAVAENIRGRAPRRGSSVEETLRDAEWPFPADGARARRTTRLRAAARGRHPGLGAAAAARLTVGPRARCQSIRVRARGTTPGGSCARAPAAAPQPPRENIAQAAQASSPNRIHGRCVSTVSTTSATTTGPQGNRGRRGRPGVPHPGGVRGGVEAARAVCSGPWGSGRSANSGRRSAAVRASSASAAALVELLAGEPAGAEVLPQRRGGRLPLLVADPEPVRGGHDSGSPSASRP